MDKTIMGTPVATPMKVPDWNQNDERKADYIKNRTHYTEEVDGKEIVHPLDKKYMPNDVIAKVDGLLGGYMYTSNPQYKETFTYEDGNDSIEASLTNEQIHAKTFKVDVNVYSGNEKVYEKREYVYSSLDSIRLKSEVFSFSESYFILEDETAYLDYEVFHYEMEYFGVTQYDRVVIYVEGLYEKIERIPIDGQNIKYGTIPYNAFDSSVPQRLYEKLNEDGYLPFIKFFCTTVDTSHPTIADLSVGFELGAGSALADNGAYVCYDLIINNERVSGVSKPATQSSDNAGLYEVIIGNKYLTDYALVAKFNSSVNLLKFNFINEDADYPIEVNEISIVVPIPYEFLGLSKGIRAGYDSEVTESSKNTHNFGTNNYIDGNYDAVFGTGHSVEGDNCTVYGQGGKIKGNLVFFGGDRCDIPGRCEFGWGTDIYMSGGNSGAIGYGLRSTGQNQFVIGQFNEENAEAYLIVGSGTEDEKRKNAFMVTKDGKVFIDGVQLVKLTQTDKDKLNSFNSSGIDNVDSGKSSTQFGVKNHNTQENVMQIGRQNSTEGSQGGYIYQFGYNNHSQAGQNYLIGRNLKSAVYEQFVIGKYNAENKDARIILGNGASDTSRANALEIMKTNDAYFAGDIYTKGKKVVTQAEVDELNQRIKSLEEEKTTLNDSVQFLVNDINSLTERLATLEGKLV